MRDVEIIWANFSGREKQYNQEGDRNFGVVFRDLEQAKQLESDGWNIKYQKDRDDPDRINFATLQIKIRYDRIPPKIYKHTSKNAVLLDEDDVSALDYDEITRIDLEARPSRWRNGEGYTAYVKTMHVTIAEDPFAADYE